jgi:hypothetical protein
VSGVTKTVFLAHLGATLAMVGLIWFVQIVHYPLFARVGGDVFAAYEADHARLTSWVVIPFMLIEAGAALFLLWQPPAGVPMVLLWVGAGLLALVWLSTFLLQVPAHDRLHRGFDADVHRWLVMTNWIRTVAWSARGVIALVLTERFLGR